MPVPNLAGLFGQYAPSGRDIDSILEGIERASAGMGPVAAPAGVAAKAARTARHLDEILPMVRAMAREVFRGLPGSIRGGIDIEDLVQEGLIAASKRLPEFDPTVGTTPQQFVRAATKGRMIDIMREAEGARRKTKPPVSLETPLRSVKGYEGRTKLGETLSGPDPVEAFETGELMSKVREATKNLTLREQQVIEGRLLGESGRETAKRLGIVESRVAQLYNSAISKLQGQLILTK